MFLLTMGQFNPFIYLLLGVLIIRNSLSQSIVIDVHNSREVQRIDSNYVGVTIDSYWLKKHFQNIDFSSTRMLTLARGLSPCNLRVGGTDADNVSFNKNSHQGRDAHEGENKRFIVSAPTFTFDTSDWDRLNVFVRNAGWDFIFDLNLALRKNGRWDPSNAIELFKYTIQKGYKLAGIELGNEMEYNKDIHISAKQSVQDFSTLKQTISSMPGLSNPTIYGPSVAGLFYQSFNYSEQFLHAGGGNYVDVITYHHYYTSGQGASVAMYHDHKALDTLKTGLTNVMNVCKRYAGGKPVWLGETSAAYSRAANNLNRRYVASFPWLDKMGVAALYGIKGLLRQAFYADLVDEKINPTNDYWVTLLFKRLVGDAVLKLNNSPNSNIRYYAHCTRQPNMYGYPKGSVTVYMMNLGSSSVSININGAGNQHLYILSPGDSGGLYSEGIKLNGNLLTMSHDTYLPQLLATNHRGTINLQGYNMAFVVLTDIKKQECM